jgi:hypothetical protein
MADATCDCADAMDDDSPWPKPTADAEADGGGVLADATDDGADMMGDGQPWPKLKDDAEADGDAANATEEDGPLWPKMKVDADATAEATEDGSPLWPKPKAHAAAEANDYGSPCPKLVNTSGKAGAHILHLPLGDDSSPSGDITISR